MEADGGGRAYSYAWASQSVLAYASEVQTTRRLRAFVFLSCLRLHRPLLSQAQVVCRQHAVTRRPAGQGSRISPAPDGTRQELW